MGFDLIIKNGKIVTPRKTFEGRDIAVKGGKIAAIANAGSLPEAGEIIDAIGKYVLPGIIDAHVHFREPGYEYKEDFGTGTTAAAIGGVTMVLDMPNNLPVCATVESLQQKIEKISTKAYVDYGLFVAILNETIGQIPELVDAGANAFKVFMGLTVGGIPAPDEVGMLKALQTISRTGLRVGVHAENNSIIAGLTAKLKREGRTDPLAHVEARPSIAEAKDIQQVIEWADKSGCKLHVCHLSSKEGVRLVRSAQNRGIDVSAETTPHYLLLDETYMEKIGGIQKINPPIRSEDHRRAIWEGILDGTIGGIATDHAPHTLEEKVNNNIWEVVPGFVGVETNVPLMLTQVNAGRLSLNDYVKLAAENPARFFNLFPQKGTIEIGADGDFTIVDMEKDGVIAAEKLHSRSRVTPFDGWKVKGMPTCTIVRGNIVMKNGKLVGRPKGKHVKATITYNTSSKWR